MNKIRILIADDHSLVRLGFASLLSYQPDFEVVGTASDGEEAVRLFVEPITRLTFSVSAIPENTATAVATIMIFLNIVLLLYF